MNLLPASSLGNIPDFHGSSDPSAQNSVSRRPPSTPRRPCMKVQGEATEHSVRPDPHPQIFKSPASPDGSADNRLPQISTSEVMKLPMPGRQIPTYTPRPNRHSATSQLFTSSARSRRRITVIGAEQINLKKEDQSFAGFETILPTHRVTFPPGTLD